MYVCEGFIDGFSFVFNCCDDGIKIMWFLYYMLNYWIFICYWNVMEDGIKWEFIVVLILYILI